MRDKGQRQIGGMLVVLGLIASVVLLWGYNYHIQTWKHLADPIGYNEDALYFLGIAQAFAELPNCFDVTIARLNAPRGANWNDFPPTHKPLYYFQGVLARGLGPVAAVNLSLLLAHILAAVSFYLTCLYFQARRFEAFIFSLFYAFSWYMVYRSVYHINLSYYWHLPFFLILVDLCFAPGNKHTRIKWVYGVGITIITGFQEAYYFYLFFLLLVFVNVILLLRRRRWDPYAPVLLGLAALTFCLHYAHYFLARLRWGPNPHALERHLVELRAYALNLTDLFWPLTYWLPWLNDLGAQQYYNLIPAMAECPGAFLGGMGIVAFVSLAVYSFSEAARNHWDGVPAEAWITILTLAWAITGGVNFILGTFGLLLFRSMSRFSIVILTMIYLFMVRIFFKHINKYLYYPLILLIVLLFGAEFYHSKVFFQTHRDQKNQVAQRLIHHDRVFAAALEASLPSGARVFQLPVVAYPEAPDRHHLGGYEHLRPYIWTNKLKFSFGDDKGRGGETWQRYVEGLPLPVMLLELVEAGFQALYINREGFTDRGQTLESELRARGLPVLAESGRGDLVAYRLQPRAAP